MQIDASLLRCFREDHARLGRALHRLSQRLRVGDVTGARAVAQELDPLAGPHIAFEEQEFYPRLVPILGANEVDRLLAEHRQALEAVRALLEHAEPPGDEGLRELLERSERMEAHIAECGELFEALGRLGREEQGELYERLLEWRRRKPLWTSLAGADEG
jgi:hypothetical protein